ncbi:MAG TPA: SUMF1/EgtB/PvdO family nonheme iron enzyme [Bryobacteraceae bacterium]|nr:SUMF1/EgtB/PvdO family nonheme iron enzyme [Bryobacteraceae bacterium]
MLSQSLTQSRAQTDALFSLIHPDAIYDRPIPERHRLVFYLGHLEAFDWNQICRRALSIPSFQPEFDKLFEFGIDPPPGKLPNDTPADWPSIAEIGRYNMRVRERIDSLLGEAPDEVIQVAIEHRLMHAETFAYLLHQLPQEKKVPQTAPVSSLLERPQKDMITIPAGATTLGKRRGDGFGWDNEFDDHTVQVPAFRISKYKVTNGEYLEFVRAGAQAPLFWTQRSGQWYWHGMFQDFPLPLEWPVYVSQSEAAAYARFMGKELPTEDQFHRAAYADSKYLYPWDNTPPDSFRGNFDFHCWDPIPVNATPAGDSVFGVSQLVGNGWEWTSTVFAPFAGFQPFPFYPGYSANFFDGEHYVMKGGSSRTAARLLRRSFRNWFRPNYPYTYAGFHLVENIG